MTRAEAQAARRRSWSALPHELKLQLAPADLAKLLKALELGERDAHHRKVWLFDTPEHALAKAGLSLRLRHKKKGADFTVKVRPLVPSNLKGRWLRSRGLDLEVDVVGSQRLLSASVVRELAPKTRDDPHLLTSPLQRALLLELAQVDLPWKRLRPTAAAQVAVWRAKPVAIERWKLPDGSVLLEISTALPGTQLQPQRLWLDLLLDTAKVRRAQTQVTKSERLLRTL